MKYKIAINMVFALAFMCSYIQAKEASGANEDIRIVKIDDSNFEKEILNTDKPTILEISSTSCPPCLVMIPTLINIAKNYPDIKVASVGIDDANIEKIKSSLPIRAFPTFFFIREGKIIDMKMGAMKEAEMFKSLQYTPKVNSAKKIAKKSTKSPAKLTCSVAGQFSGLKNNVTMILAFENEKIENVDIFTDVFIPPELENRRSDIKAKFEASAKGDVKETMTGFQLHTKNDSPFMKAMNMNRLSSYSEMKAGLELQGFKCK